MEKKNFFKKAMIISFSLAAISFIPVACSSGKTDTGKEDQQVIDDIVANFEKLAAIPRKSGHEQAVGEMLKNWARDQGLEVRQNEAGDLFFDVPATKGYEDLPLTCLQAHIDMVCVARDGVDYDPLTDPIKTVIDDEKQIMSADGTSLGADDGIGVAMIMSITEGKTEHGPLRVIFTTDEEVGFSGAMAVEAGDLKDVKYLLNIDSEVSDTLTVSSAGGSSVVATADPIVVTSEKDSAVKIEIAGLMGGHSGQTIGEGRVNGITELCRLLKDMKEKTDFDIVSITGGQADNAIPDKAAAIINIAEFDKKAAGDFARAREKEINDKYAGVENDVKITVSENEKSDKALAGEQADNILIYVTESIDGVYSMSEEVEGLVESSSNTGHIKADADGIEIRQMPRSSSDEKLEEIHEHQKELALKTGLDITVTVDTKAWPVNPDSVLAVQIPEIYKKQNGKEMTVTGLHAGLECAEFYRIDDSIDMVSIGPDIDEVHSPNEVVHLDSIPVTWNVLKELLTSLK